MPAAMNLTSSRIITPQSPSSLSSYLVAPVQNERTRSTTGTTNSTQGPPSPTSVSSTLPAGPSHSNPNTTNATHTVSSTSLGPSDRALNASSGDAATRFRNDSLTPSPTIKFQDLVTLKAFKDQECKTFGPLCQTGFFTLGTSTAGSIATTSIPCSSYLAAQASEIKADPDLSYSWGRNFGRSPQCTSYAKAIMHHDLRDSPKLFSDCPASYQQGIPTGIPIDEILPPAVSFLKGNKSLHCCGPCAIFVPRVRLIYFPEEGQTRCGASQTETPMSTITPGPQLQSDGQHVFVSDNFTL